MPFFKDLTGTMGDRRGDCPSVMVLCAVHHELQTVPNGVSESLLFFKADVGTLLDLDKDGVFEHAKTVTAVDQQPNIAYAEMPRIMRSSDR